MSGASRGGEYDILSSVMQEFIVKIKFKSNWIFPLLFALVLIVLGYFIWKAFDIQDFQKDTLSPYKNSPYDVP